MYYEHAATDSPEELKHNIIHVGCYHANWSTNIWSTDTWSISLLK